jgi:thiol:disulfide interchange protein/DsbC/DsbD-like thiol-disulfide interchange protein
MNPAFLALVVPLAFGSGGASPPPPAAPEVSFAGLPATADVHEKGPDGKLHPVRARLLLEKTTVAAGATQRVGLHLKQAKDWHTYWKSPGDIGLPTDITWTLPAGVTAAPHVYPVPQRFEAEGIVSYGYDDQVLLISELAVPADLAPGTYEVRAEASWLVCQSSCIPGGADLRLPIEVVAAGTPVSDAPWAPLFAHFAAQHPAPAAEAGLSFETSLSVPALVPNKPFRAEFLVKSANGPIALPAAGGAWPTFTPIVAPDWMLATENPIEVRAVDGGVLVVVRGEALEPDPLPTGQQIGGLFQLQVGDRLVRSELLAPLPWAASDATAAAPAPAADPPAAAPVPQPPSPGGLALNLFFAFVGGLILNVMPCVLPVLTLKLYGLVEQADIAPRERHLAAGAYTIGILASFWALAATVVLARVVFGVELGWGSQFQYPPYVAALATIVFAFGLSLFGVFEIPALGVDAASGASTREGTTGYFFTGVFATLLATPCSAPFLGTAVAFAFAAPTPELIAIFTAVGFGLAFPFLVVAFVPRLYALMPRPGEWMDWFKQLLGFSLIATTIWLVGVLATQIGPDRTTWFLVFLLAVSMACWIYGRWGGVIATRQQHAGALAAALGVAAAGAWFFVDLEYAEAVTCDAAPVAVDELSYDHEVPWQDFSPATIDATAGNTVFVDFTADWCLTCKVNEKTVLSTATVRDAMREHKVVPLKGDWTVRDPVITEWLTRYGKAGVPFYLVIPADRSRPHLPLPEVITPEMVASSLREASAAPR